MTMAIRTEGSATGVVTYRGSCHCGAVAFECDLDLGTGSQRCNCSVCSKHRFWKAMVADAAFRLISGTDELADYQFGSDNIHHRFCRTCGTKPFGTVDLPEIGRLVAVNIACLDGLSDEQRAAIPVRYEDGRGDAWERAPAVTSHL
jgi:hypothetical protein